MAGSGRFAGFRAGDALYDPAGVHVGWFDRDVAFTLAGARTGEVTHGDWLGRWHRS